MADLPIKELGDEAPVYDRHTRRRPRLPLIDPASIEAPMPHGEALESCWLRRTCAPSAGSGSSTIT
jgi:hypothetical protein